MKRTWVICVLFLAILQPLLAKRFTDHRIRKMVPLTGRVIDDETKAPVVTKLTFVLKDFGAIEVSTNSNGEFTANIPESDECKIMVRAAGFEAQDGVVQLAPNASHYIELHLIPYVKLVVDGVVTNGKDKQPIQAELRVFHNSDFEKEDDKIISSGKYSEPLVNFGYYLISVSAKGYVDKVDTVWVLSCSRKKIHKDYQLQPIEAGLTIQLKNIYFNFGKATLSPDSYAALDDVAAFFKNNPTMKAKIAGHTDSDGPEDYNLVLSQLRAEEVACYLEDKGVKEEQIVAIGYGATKPIDSNLTQSGKANNRRVEMIVIRD